jgi:hypothetical protein
VSPVKYELGFYIPEDDILHSHRRENLKSYRDEYIPWHYYEPFAQMYWMQPQRIDHVSQVIRCSLFFLKSRRQKEWAKTFFVSRTFRSEDCKQDEVTTAQLRIMISKFSILYIRPTDAIPPYRGGGV